MDKILSVFYNALWFVLGVIAGIAVVLFAGKYFDPEKKENDAE